MNAPGEQPAQQATSALGEAVEQLAGAGLMWCGDVAGFAQREAELLASGGYGLANLATAPVRFSRVWLSNAIRMAGVLSDNLALLSYSGQSSTPTERVFRTRVQVSGATPMQLSTSDLIGQLTGHRIAGKAVQVNPNPLPGVLAPQEETVELTVRCARVPNDTYAGVLRSADNAITEPIRVVIDELGEPLP